MGVNGRECPKAGLLLHSGVAVRDHAEKGRGFTGGRGCRRRGAAWRDGSQYTGIGAVGTGQREDRQQITQRLRNSKPVPPLRSERRPGHIVLQRAQLCAVRYRLLAARTTLRCALPVACSAHNAALCATGCLQRAQRCAVRSFRAARAAGTIFRLPSSEKAIF